MVVSLVYTDQGRQRVSGGLLSNTLAAAPSPVVKENIKVDAAGTSFTGNILVASRRQFAITGYVDTSHGRVQTIRNPQREQRGALGRYPEL